MTEKNKLNSHTVSRKLKISHLFLVLFTTAVALGLILLEVNGRSQGINSPEQWYEMMKDHPYMRQNSDLRSPCPMINTLANHGFLPRNGRDVKPSDIYHILSLLRVPPTISAGFIAFVYSQYNEALPSKHFISQFGFTDTIHLNKLGVYDVLEHDVSLTRQDLAIAPHNTTFPEEKYINRMVRLSELNNTNTENKGYFTWENEHDARKLRWLESVRDNSLFHYPFSQQFASSFECLLLLDIIGREGKLRLDHLESILLHERFPDDWYPPTKTPSLSELIVNPFNCWRGLHQSKVSLDLLSSLE